MKILYGVALTAALFAGSAVLADPKPQTITLAGGPSVSAIYAIAAGLGSMIEKKIPGSRVTVVEGGTVSNVLRAKRDQIQMGYSKPATIYAAQNGTGKPFESPSSTVVSVAGVTSGPLHMAIDSSTGIRSFQEIVEKKYPLKIAVGQVGYSSEVFFRQILEAYGLTYDDIRSWGGEVRLVSMAEGATAMQDGQLEAVITPDVLPHAGITRIAQSRDVNLVSFPDAIIQKLSEKYGYSRSVIPSGTYRGVGYDVATLDDPYIVIAREDLPEEFVYAFVKAFLSNEGRDYFKAISTPVSFVTPQDAYDMVAKNKLHPGASKYFEEIGVKK